MNDPTSHPVALAGLEKLRLWLLDLTARNRLMDPETRPFDTPTMLAGTDQTTKKAPSPFCHTGNPMLNKATDPQAADRMTRAEHENKCTGKTSLPPPI